MSSPPAATRRRLFADTTPLREVPAFRWLWVGQSLAGIGTQLTVVTVGLQVFALTSSTFAVGLVGVVALVPLVGLGLYGGALVDAHDRRRVALLASAVLWVLSIAIAAQAWWHVDSVGLLYVLVALQSAAFAVNNPARSAIVPGIVPRHLLPAANALSGTTNAIALTVGPLLAGFLVATWGFQAAYTVDAVTFVAALVGVHRLRPCGRRCSRAAGGPACARCWRASASSPPGPTSGPPSSPTCAPWCSPCRACCTPRSVPPNSAGERGPSDCSGRGSRSAPSSRGCCPGPSAESAGRARSSSAASPSTAPRSPRSASCSCSPRRGGREALGLRRAARRLRAADAVSSIFRGTILQVATPDALRGRLQGVFIVVVAGGPRLGDLVLGSAATGVGEGLAALAGGAACVVAVLALASAQRGFLRYDARHPAP